MADMKGKTLFISGGTRGIGKAIVYAFAKEGCDVAFTYASSVDTANEIIADITSNYGVKCRAYKLDILEPTTYKDVYKAFDEDFDRLVRILIDLIILSQMLLSLVVLLLVDLVHLCVSNQEDLTTSTRQLLMLL